MGNFIHNSTNRTEDQNIDNGIHQYIYPPKNGTNYFSNHFIMGGQKFETSSSEAFLFGENLDLNFLGNRPTPFPYLPPQPQEPTRTLSSLMNIRKESLRFVKCKMPEELNEEFVSKEEDEIKKINQPIKKEDNKKDDHKKEEHHKKSKNKNKIEQTKEMNTKLDQNEVINEKQSTNYNPNTNYNIEFVFDTDVKCAINIYYFCYEEIKPNCVTYTSKNLYANSSTYFYECGANQLFSQTDHVFNPSLYNESDLIFKPLDEEGNFILNNTFPMVIQCVALEGDDPKQSHSLIATIERNHDGKGYSLKPFKQKLFIDGLCYLMQEIYGIEKKNPVTISYSHYNNLSYKPDEENSVLNSTVNSGSITNNTLNPTITNTLNHPPPFISTDDGMDEDNGAECVICMVQSRDTLILPCRHLCLCNLCSDSLRYQSSLCPICRAPFRALLQIKAVRKINDPLPNSNLNLSLTFNQSNQLTAQAISNSQSPIPQVINSQLNQPNSRQQSNEIEDIQIPTGYESISLVEGLNGPFIKNHSISSMKNMLIHKNNTNSINENSYSENLTPKSQRSQISGQLSTNLSTNLSNGLNVSKYPCRKQKLRKQNSNTSLNSLRNEILNHYGSNLSGNLGQENESVSLNLDEEDSIEQNWRDENLELANGIQLNLSTKSTSSSIGQETTKLLSNKQNKDDFSLRKRSSGVDTHSNQSRTSITIDTTSNIVYPRQLKDDEQLCNEVDRITIKDSSPRRHTPEIAEDDD